MSGRGEVRARSFVALTLFVSFALFLTACSGQGQRRGDTGATNTPPPTQTPSVAAEPGGSFAGEELVPPIPAPPFNLTDHEGRRTRLSDYKGRYVLLSFAYTGCPDICPTLARSFREVEKAFANDIDRRISFVIISLDPEGDTAEKAKRWTRAFHGSWRFLIGSRPDLEKIWDAYGVVVQTASDGGISHSVMTYLIDPNGLVRLRYGGLGWDKAVIGDLAKLLGR